MKTADLRDILIQQVDKVNLIHLLKLRKPAKRGPLMVLNLFKSYSVFALIIILNLIAIPMACFNDYNADKSFIIFSSMTFLSLFYAIYIHKLHHKSNGKHKRIHMTLCLFSVFFILVSVLLMSVCLGFNLNLSFMLFKISVLWVQLFLYGSLIIELICLFMMQFQAEDFIVPYILSDTSALIMNIFLSSISRMDIPPDTLPSDTLHDDMIQLSFAIVIALTCIALYFVVIKIIIKRKS